jgi:uracil-DNA glycosylase
MSHQEEKWKDLLAPGWYEQLSAEFSKPYIENIRQLLETDKQNGIVCFPSTDKIFRALKLVNYDDVKIVILGQDPYHGPGQANGLAFAVNDDTPTPPSLVNIFKEIARDFRTELPKNRNLESWAKQGVLLLNTVLTVRANQAFSHRKKGWEQFTDQVILSLNKKKTPVVFLLWGAAAESKSKMITNPNHLILTSSHPSPLSVYRGFSGCGHFSKANLFLKKSGINEINWCL